MKTIDVSPWFARDSAQRDRLLSDLDEECRRIGFLRISGHGIPTDLIDRMFSATTAFFDQPDEVKSQYLLEDEAPTVASGPNHNGKSAPRQLATNISA